MLNILSKRKTKNYAKEHFLEFARIYNMYKRGNYSEVVSEGEHWLTKFPNSEYIASNEQYEWSNDPDKLTTKNYVFFSNTLYLGMAISAFELGNYKKSLRYRKCMMENVAFGEHSGEDPALAWRLLSLSIRRDAKLYGLPEYLNNIRNIDEKELSNAGAYGKYYYQIPKTQIDMEKGEITAVYPDETYNIDFRIDGSIKRMFTNISEWIIKKGDEYDWVGKFPFNKEWLRILDASKNRT